MSDPGSLPRAGGVHCETSALGVLLEPTRVRLSEPMLFGLGAGLSFIYWDSRAQPLPFLGGRVKPFALTPPAVERIGAELRTQETSSRRVAWDGVRRAIDAGDRVGLQLDSYHLEYFRTRVHFAGHIVAMTGYDEHDAHLVDTAQQGGQVSTSLHSLADARDARGPMSARNRWFTVHAPQRDISAEDLAPQIVDAIVTCAQAYLNPPIANVGGRGVQTAARRMRSWFDRVADPSVDLPMIATLMERAGTGGGLFRRLYRDFLVEAREVIDAAGVHGGALDRGIALMTDAADRWTQVAGLLDAAGRGRDAGSLEEASRVVASIADLEISAMEALCVLGHADVGGHP